MLYHMLLCLNKMILNLTCKQPREKTQLQMLVDRLMLWKPNKSTTLHLQVIDSLFLKTTLSLFTVKLLLKKTTNL